MVVDFKDVVTVQLTGSQSNDWDDSKMLLSVPPAVPSTLLIFCLLSQLQSKSHNAPPPSYNSICPCKAGTKSQCLNKGYSWLWWIFSYVKPHLVSLYIPNKIWRKMKLMLRGLDKSLVRYISPKTIKILVEKRENKNFKDNHLHLIFPITVLNFPRRTAADSWT